MALTENIRDLINYPSVTKTVTLDLQKIIPIDEEGDEKYVLYSAAGTGSVDVNGDAIGKIYIRNFKAGYARSSGKKNSPFNVTSGSKTFRISIDGSSYENITLNEGNGLTGETVSDDMQNKINALYSTTQSGNLAFLNATVEFKNNAFLLVAGSVSNTYVGTGKSSVALSSGTTNDISIALGLDNSYTSEALSSKQATETVLTSLYTASGSALTVESIVGLSAGEAITISDGINREYSVISGVATSTINLYVPLNNNYASGSVVQKIFERDPRAELASPYTTIDDITRFSLRSIANQIDFSS